ncbi:hypothetical protein LX36DRAFT_668792 [Colletotrichum falcatum]|nr:hypothetical protein LX36DRAFT_668792 [Colletotrichum falcatum]
MGIGPDTQQSPQLEPSMIYSDHIYLRRPDVVSPWLHPEAESALSSSRSTACKIPGLSSYQPSHKLPLDAIGATSANYWQSRYLRLTNVSSALRSRHMQHSPRLAGNTHASQGQGNGPRIRLNLGLAIEQSYQRSDRVANNDVDSLVVVISHADRVAVSQAPTSSSSHRFLVILHADSTAAAHHVASRIVLVGHSHCWASMSQEECGSMPSWLAPMTKPSPPCLTVAVDISRSSQQQS